MHLKAEYEKLEKQNIKVNNKVLLVELFVKSADPEQGTTFLVSDDPVNDVADFCRSKAAREEHFTPHPFYISGQPSGDDIDFWTRRRVRASSV